MPLPTDRHSSPRRRLLGGAVTGLALATVPWARAADYPEIAWDALIPPGWNPMNSFRDLQNLAALPDSDARVAKLYDRMRKVWDEAPTVPSLEGKPVRIPGFIVPLENSDKGLKEFLLVPYFGACIHTPPPPANQIIHVKSNTPVRGFATMSAVWVSGTMGLERSDSDMGVSGYTMSAVSVVKYREGDRDRNKGGGGAASEQGQVVP